MRFRVATRAALRALVALATVAAGAASSSAAPSSESAGAPATIDRARSSVVSVLGVRLTGPARARRAAHSLASGVIYDPSGRVVTVASAVRDCDSIRVRLADGREMAARLVGRDDDSDVGVLELPARDLPSLRIPEASAGAAGQAAWAVAAGAGAHPKVTRGTVRRRYEEPLGSLLLLTNEVYPGFSGGAVVDENGDVLGLVVGRLDQAPADWADAPAAGEGASFALAGDDLKTIIGQIERFGRVRRGFLGVRMTQGEVVDAARPDDPFRIGVRVEEVLPGSPAAQLDLRTGDLIVGWNGETLQSPEDLMRRVEGSPPGTIVPLVWVRDEERREGRLVVGEKPAEDLVAAPRGAAPSPDSTGRPREGG